MNVEQMQKILWLLTHKGVLSFWDKKGGRFYAQDNLYHEIEENSQKVGIHFYNFYIDYATCKIIVESFSDSILTDTGQEKIKGLIKEKLKPHLKNLKSGDKS